MKKLFFFVLSINVFFLSSGCTLYKISGTGRLPIVLNQMPYKSQIVQSVEVEKQITFDYTGSMDVNDILKKEIGNMGGDAIVNTKINIKGTVGDYFLNLFTLGLAYAHTVEITGDVIKYVR